jgi:hypothetical protein
MIRYLKHSDIDKAKWDESIDRSVNGIVYAKSWYLDVVSPDWEALVGEDYKTLFPLTYRKKYGFSYLYPPFFTQQLGVFSETELTPETISKFLNSIPNKFRFIEINLNHHNKLTNSDFKVWKKRTHHLNLNESYNNIAKGYSENLKRNLRKAIQNNLQATSEFKNETLINLFRSTKGKEVHTLKDSDYERMKKLLSECEKRNLLTKSGVKINNELAAGVLFLHSNHEYILIFSSVNEAAKETGAMAFLIDNFIQNHHNENLNLDFEGSMDKNLARFYKSFRANEIVYLQIKKNCLPVYLRWLKN